MKRTLRISTAVAAVVVASVLSVPAAAQAAGVIYPPSGACSVTPANAAPGAVLSFSCDAETFSANERVTVTLSGENGAEGRVGAVLFAVSTASGLATSTASGSLPGVRITLPANASGIYNVAAVSATSAGGTAAVSLTSADGSALPATGLDSAATLGLWIGGGALVLAGAAFVAIAAIRRSRSDR